MHARKKENNTLTQNTNNGRSTPQSQKNTARPNNASNEANSNAAKNVILASKVLQQIAQHKAPTITGVKQIGAEAEARNGVNGNNVPDGVHEAVPAPVSVNRSSSAYLIGSCTSDWTTGSNSRGGSPNRVVRTVRTNGRTSRRASTERIGSRTASPDSNQMMIERSVPPRQNTPETIRSSANQTMIERSVPPRQSTPEIVQSGDNPTMIERSVSPRRNVPENAQNKCDQRIDAKGIGTNEPSKDFITANLAQAERLDESQSQNKIVDQEQGTVVAPNTEANADDVSDSLKKHIDSLSENHLNWYETLGTILKLVRKPTSVQQERVINQLLIELKFVNKLRVYLESLHVKKLTEVTSETHQADQVWATVKRFLTIIWMVTDRDVNFCQHTLGSNIFAFVVAQLVELATQYTQCDWSLFVIKASIGILHNIARQVPNSKWTFRNEGLVTALQTYIRSKIPMVKLKALIVLSYILSEAENEMINSDDDNFVFIFNVLSDALGSTNHRSSKYGMSVLEVLTGVDNLAINDENKIRIVRNGALGLYQEILVNGNPQETKQAIVTLWSLAFHHYNKQKMRAMPGIMERLDELQQSSDEGICHAARGTFWELENTSKTAIGSRSASSSSSSTESDAGQPHIMISYQWDSQPVMLKIKDKLKHAGYKVWMDVEHMSGSTLEAMALAVEKAAVVLVCMSQKYKDSPNCRTEAEYVYRLRKDFVPLRLQQEYVPDGWLGILVGTRLYFDVYAEDALDAQIPRLIKELRDRGRISPTRDATDTGVASLVPRRMFSREAVPVLQSTGTEVINWDCHDLLDWLSTAGVPEIHDRLDDVDGPLLLEMQKIQRQAPEYFYSMLRAELGMTTVQILKFSKSLRSLR